jgi:hypothetical protein
VTLRARWVTLRARWVTLRARWVTLRARWVTLRARWVTLRARWVTLRARWVTQVEELSVSNYRTYHILNEIVDQWVVWSLKGGVAVPPPIQSRTYQIISEAQLAFNAAQKIQSTPFPYPLMQV